jgi:hypothetical protein
MSPYYPKLLRWAARIAGLLVLSTVLIIAFGEGFPNPLTLTALEQLQSLSILVMLVGIILAWKWEGLGGSLLLLGFFTESAIEGFRYTLTVISFFDYFLLLGLMNVSVWWASKRTQGSSPS